MSLKIVQREILSSQNTLNFNCLLYRNANRNPGGKPPDRGPVRSQVRLGGEHVEVPHLILVSNPANLFYHAKCAPGQVSNVVIHI